MLSLLPFPRQRKRSHYLPCWTFNRPNLYLFICVFLSRYGFTVGQIGCAGALLAHIKRKEAELNTIIDVSSIEMFHLKDTMHLTVDTLKCVHLLTLFTLTGLMVI